MLCLESFYVNPLYRTYGEKSPVKSCNWTDFTVSFSCGYGLDHGLFHYRPMFMLCTLFNTLTLRKNDYHSTDNSFKCIAWISINVSLKFVLKGPINNISVFVQIMAWRGPGDKPSLSEPMMVGLPTHICVTRPKKIRFYKYITETKMSSFWRNFHHWLHWKLSFWQLSVQPVMKISSKWRHFRFSDGSLQYTIIVLVSVPYNRIPHTCCCADQFLHFLKAFHTVDHAILLITFNITLLS